MPNITLAWSKANPTLHLSKGGHNTLMSFGQLPLRVLEQSIYTNYSPTLHAGSGIVTFFNHKLYTSLFSKAVDYKTIYQAVDETGTVVYAQEYTPNKLCSVINLTETSVRNNMN